jgi:glycosyltransferase involved in cell wall biosynthesis
MNFTPFAPRSLPAVGDSAAGAQPADYPLSGQSIVCFAGEDWWYHHPHSKNHILKRLARHNRVLFVNSITMGLPSIGSPDFFQKIRRKLRSYLRWLRKVPEGLWVMTPISVPLYGSLMGRVLNRLLLILQIRLVVLILRLRDPIIWAAIPTAADIVTSLGGKLLVYQVSDKYDCNEDSALSHAVIRDMDARLKQLAAVVMYSGRKLYEEAEIPHRYFLEQAVDFERFAILPPETPPDIAAIPRPVLGYVGAADFYTMDVPLIKRVAELRPNWHWVFIGGKSNVLQLSGPNIHFLGPKPYSELPAYYRHIDVCVLPWNQRNVFTSYGSAIKVREYLATGKPVVISPLYEYLHTPGVRIYRTVEEFIALVGEALTCETSRDRQIRQEVVRHCTWDARAREVASLFRQLLDGESVGEAALPCVVTLQTADAERQSRYEDSGHDCR